MAKFIKGGSMKPTQIYPKLNEIENEIQNLKVLILKIKQTPKRLVSLRGMGKLLVDERELEKNIETARSSWVNKKRP